MNLEQQPQQSREAPKKKRAFEGLTAMSTSERQLPAVEKQRREDVKARMMRVTALDEEFFKTVPQSGETLKQRIDRVEAAETLALGKELARETIGAKEVGINALTKRTYEGDPRRTAYVKPQSGEASYRYENGKALKISRTLGKNGLETTESEITGQDAQGIERMAAERAQVIEGVAEYYGIPKNEVPLSQTEFSPRRGIDAGDYSMREYAVSRIDTMLNFGLVPMTVLRAEEGNTDLLSVQEAAHASDFTAKPLELNEDVYTDLKEQGPSHPGAKSFMRMACLDYLVRSQDRHPSNMLYFETHDEKTGKTKGEFKAIDNGLSLGLSYNEKRMVNGETQTTGIPADAYLSIPMEMVQGNPHWELDNEAIDHLKDLAKRMIENVQDPAKIGPAYALKKIFYELYGGNQKIADKEILGFIERLSMLIKLRRPPELVVGPYGQGNTLLPAREIYELEKPRSERAEQGTAPQKRAA